MGRGKRRPVKAAGREKVQALYFGPTDHTHTTVAGAELNAASVVEGLLRLKECALCTYLAPAEQHAAASQQSK